ncbi:type II toxin-antitoxin system PemK/MazF family toxin [Bacteroidetes/Chlorobi group bacterium ChocPot_Mid]|jgi:mRNA interferase MazF|nr:MAG: type II toxin-antitoxin system PemK/MazF family toxin [Bacteroidetes/Chlorobi group bacterium ChocPot_Mid]
MGLTTNFRWGIYLVNLDPVVGSEQGKTRPALVISEEAINQILPIVNILPITSRKPNRVVYPNEVLIRENLFGLNHDSVILCHQVRTVDKSRLIKYIGTIDNLDIQEEILSAIRFQLGI